MNILKNLISAVFFCSLCTVFAADIYNDPGRKRAEYQKEALDASELISEAKEADAIARKAAGYYKDAKYKQAIDSYLKARNILLRLAEKNPEYLKKIESCKEAISKCYFYWAEQLYFEALSESDAKRYDKAISNCEEAMKMWPPAKPKLQVAIERFQDLKKAAEVQAQFKNDSSIPEQQHLYSIDVLMRQGDAFFARKLWDNARDKYEEILAIDPYNTKAIEAIRRVNLSLLKAGTMRHELTRSEYITEAAWKPMNPLKPRVFKENSTESAADPIQKGLAVDPLIKKLNSIVIPRLDFERITISELLDYLRRRSKELDKEHVGVNIFYLRPVVVSDKADAAEPAAPGAAPAAPGAPNNPPAPNQQQAAPKNAPAGGADGGLDGEEQNVMVSFDNLSLFKIIEEICKMAKLKFKIEKYAVVIADPNVSFEELETRIYPIEAEVVSKLSSDTGGGGKKDAGGDAGGSVTGDTTARKYFESAGITFGPGADVVYDTYCRRLVATNTRSNLEKLEKILHNLNITDPQVLIQCKFIEITLNDLEELGFRYYVSRTNSNADAYASNSDLVSYKGQKLNADTLYSFYTSGSTAATANGYSVLSGTYRGNEVPSSLIGNSTFKQATLQQKSVTWGRNDNLVRDAQSLSGRESTVDGFLSYTFTTNGINAQAQVNAVDQADSSDILACPKITTLNGYDATIAMVMEKYFPDDWSEAELGTIAGTGGTSVPLFTPSIPDFGDAQRLGIELKVKPMVDMSQKLPDTIDIKMSPVINQHIDWSDYSYNLTVSTGENGASQTYTNIIKKPIFEVRSIDTQVHCLDGETLVLGGMVRDTVNAIDDQYPILGDLPLVGRLFQSKAKSSQKKNLLIFLTCRLINPDGTPIRERAMRGLPPFRQ